MKVWALLQGLGDRPADFGLIHADLHQWNYLFHQEQVGVIDFDDCGYGHWLYDLAVTLYCLEDRPGFTALKDAFLTGYRRRRPLSVQQEEHLQTFVALRRLQDLLWVIGERERPTGLPRPVAGASHGPVAGAPEVHQSLGSVAAATCPLRLLGAS